MKDEDEDAHRRAGCGAPSTAGGAAVPVALAAATGKDAEDAESSSGNGGDKDDAEEDDDDNDVIGGIVMALVASDAPRGLGDSMGRRKCQKRTSPALASASAAILGGKFWAAVGEFEKRWGEKGGKTGADYVRRGVRRSALGCL